MAEQFPVIDGVVRDFWQFLSMLSYHSQTQLLIWSETEPTVWRSAVCWVWQVLSPSTSEDKKNRLLPALQQHCNSGIILEISTVVRSDLQIGEQNELVWILNNPISAGKIPRSSPSSSLDNNEKTNKQTNHSTEGEWSFPLQKEPAAPCDH